MTLGKRIKERRQYWEMTQKQLADKIGVSRITVSKYENDESEPSLFIAMCLATVLRVSLQWLATGKGECYD